VARNLAEQCWRPEIEKNLGAVDSCLPSWRLHRRRFDGYRESRWCGVKVEPRGGRRWWLNGGENLIHGISEQGGRHGDEPEWRPAHRRGRSFNPAMLSIHPRHESGRRRHESRRGSSAVSGAVDLIFIRHCTMGCSISAPDSQSLSMIFSQISMATYPSLCSKVVVL
jgi:hypothetical protein